MLGQHLHESRTFGESRGGETVESVVQSDGHRRLDALARVAQIGVLDRLDDTADGEQGIKPGFFGDIAQLVAQSYQAVKQGAVDPQLAARGRAVDGQRDVDVAAPDPLGDDGFRHRFQRIEAWSDSAPQIEVPAVDALDLEGPDIAVVGPVRSGEPGHAGDLMLSAQRCLAGTKVWSWLYLREMTTTSNRGLDAPGGMPCAIPGRF